MEALQTLDRHSLQLDLLDRLANAAPQENSTPGSSLHLYHENEFARGYAEGLLDLLAGLGALTYDANLGEVNVHSLQAGHTLTLLRAFLTEHKQVIADWSREGLSPCTDMAYPFGSAADFNAALEQRRLQLDAHAQPLREGSAAVGLLMRSDGHDGRMYLFSCDDAAGMWQLPGGRRDRHDQSLRATMLRELREELCWDRLHEPHDLRLVELGEPFAKQWVSPTYGLLTRTVFQPYAVQLMHSFTALHDGLRWVSEGEVLAGVMHDGKLLSAAPLRHVLELGLDLDAYLSAA